MALLNFSTLLQIQSNIIHLKFQGLKWLQAGTEQSVQIPSKTFFHASIGTAFCHYLIWAFHFFAGWGMWHLACRRDAWWCVACIYISWDSHPPTETGRQYVDEAMWKGFTEMYVGLLHSNWGKTPQSKTLSHPPSHNNTSRVEGEITLFNVSNTAACSWNIYR